MTRHWAVGIVSALIVALLTASCTAIHTLPIRRAGGFVGNIVGDQLAVTTRDGHDHQIRVAAVQPDIVTGTDKAVCRFADVLMVQRRELDRRKNVILVSVIGAVMALGAIAAATGWGVPPVTYVTSARTTANR
jgi:hypothetical protein